MTNRRIPAVLATAGIVLAFAACGGDDDESAPATTAAAAATEPAGTEPAATEAAGTEPAGTEPEGSAPAGSVNPEFAEYCALSLELDQQEDLPSAEQMEAILAAAPEEIAAEAKTVVDAYIAAGADDFSVFIEYETELAAIEAFDAEQCGIVTEEEEPLDPEMIAIDPDATRVDVTATDFAFDFTPPTTAGRYSFVMANDGEEPHLMVLFKLDPASTLDEVIAAQGEEGVLEEYESEVSIGGGESVVTADLSAGHWVLLCPIPSPANDDMLHLELGMLQEWDVT